MTNFLPPARARLTDSDGDMSGPWLLWAEKIARRMDERTDFPPVDASPPSIAANGAQQTTVNVRDVRPGDFVYATYSPGDAGVLVTADVITDDEVTVTFRNITPAPIALAAGQIFLRVERRR